MYVHSIARGTRLTITFGDGTVIEAVFDGNIDHIKFYVHSPEILKNLDKFKETQPTVTFFHEDKHYTFTAKILDKSVRDALHETLDFIAVSPFKEKQRRSDFRIQILLRVKIHAYSGDYRRLYTGDWLCDAVSEDVSKNGICLWADHCLDEEINAKYTLEFTLHTGRVYLVPATLTRHQRNVKTRSYNYDYGFVFDFSNMPDRREKLLMDILEHKIRTGV